MNVLIIYATGTVTGTIFDNTDINKIPIGCYYLASYLRKNNINTELLYFLNMSDCDYILEFIKKYNPDIIGFSSFLFNHKFLMELTLKIKEANPNIKIVLGGIHATILHRELIEEHKQLDALLRGEAEKSFLELVRSGFKEEAMQQINGLTWRHENMVFVNPDSIPTKNLDEFPSPVHHGFNYNFISTSRGCPGKCTFCGAPKISGRLVRLRSSEHIYKELRELKYTYGVSYFEFMDDTFCANKTRVIDLCQRIIDSKLAIQWHVRNRVNFIDWDMFQLMKKAGCVQISYGVESGSQRILNALNKQTKTQQISEAFALTKACGIKTRMYIIHCGAMENIRSLISNIWTITKCYPDLILLYQLQIFPGTQLYDTAVEQGLIEKDIWKRQSHVTYPSGNPLLFDILHKFITVFYKLTSMSQRLFNKRN
ncbi:MAG: cobalamin-dependent protein [Deltaproteobacteria bacterium]|nr:cobalamin-dependent protein [Deltaproteobacteria bacterium]